jgi:hypothetical protein
LATPRPLGAFDDGNAWVWVSEDLHGADGATPGSAALSVPASRRCEEEGVVFNAEISAGIQESLADADYGQLLAGRGIATVALTEDGQMVEHRPDGTSVLVTARP